MSTRHSGRKLAMQVLYQVVTRDQDISDFIDSVIENSDMDKSIKNWSKELALGTWSNKDQIDLLIDELAVDWTIDRMSLLDVSILRLGFYELTKSNTPHNVVVNEAVELAKEFSSFDSPKFINGILGNYVKQYVHRANR